MLDRKVVEEFLTEKMKDVGIDIPKGIDKRNWLRHFAGSQKMTSGVMKVIKEIQYVPN